MSGVLASLTDGTNPYFSAGFGLFAMGAGLAALRSGWKHGVHYARRNYLVSLEIPSKDPSFSWVLQWISSRAKQTQHLSVETSYQKGFIHPLKFASKNDFFI